MGFGDIFGSSFTGGTEVTPFSAGFGDFNVNSKTNWLLIVVIAAAVVLLAVFLWRK